MSETPIDGRDRAAVLVHYYRAMVGRADILRMRMDATTNWAIGATAAVGSFTLGSADAPHFAIHIATLLTLAFLLLEARRLTFYHLWQQRVLLLENGWIRPALSPDASTEEELAGLARELDPHLGSTVPTMPIAKAVARRLRRIYLYLFAVQLAAWGLKLGSHPVATNDPAEILARARIGLVPGDVVWALAGGLFLALCALALAFGGVDRRRSNG